MNLEGGCRCGAARYVLAVAQMPPIYCCHCLDCQTTSGSAFSEQAVIREDAITLSGPIVDYVYDTRSGAVSHHRLCAACHTRLYNSNAARPGLALLRAGTLDDSAMTVPRAHIWIERKQSWIVLPDDVPTFAQNAPLAEMTAILMR